NTQAVESALPEHHLAEAREIGAGREQTGVTGDAAHGARGRIMNDAAQIALGRGYTASQCGWRLKSGVGHPERRIEVFPRVLVERLAAEATDDFAQQDEIDIAVDEALSRRGGWLIGKRQPDPAL